MLQKIYLLLSLFLLPIFFSGCGTTGRVSKNEPPPPPYEPPPVPAQKNPPPKAENLKPGKTIEKGRASWYGPNFHGKLTANGEEYNMNGLTAAHRTLPFNTILKVKNLDNGESVEVRVNDRGPFAKNRIIDLSKKAARSIGMLGPGTANVALIMMKGDLENSKTTNLKVATYTIQLGSFQQQTKAFALSRKVQGSHVEKVSISNHTFYRVFYGKFIAKDEARKKNRELNQQGFSGYIKQIENNR